MVLRWTAADVLEAERKCRRVNIYTAMPKLVVALSAHNASLSRSGKDLTMQRSPLN